MSKFLKVGPCGEGEGFAISDRYFLSTPAGLEVIKLEFILKLKIKRNDWLFADTCPQAANHCTFFESETVLKFYNLGAYCR